MKKKNFTYIMFFFLILTLCNNISFSQKMENSTMEEYFVHPFLTHMALADPPGEVSFRFTALQIRDEDGPSDDLGLHIEAGLLSRLGLHIRNDAFKQSPFTEVMLMYNVLVSRNDNNGISIFGQVNIPTGPISTNTFEGLFGVGIRGTVPKITVFNGDIHYDPKNNMSEYEGSFVFRGSSLLFPIIELRGEITDQGTSLYVLPALNFRIQENQTLGAGFQFAVSKEREYDEQVLFQYGIEF